MSSIVIVSGYFNPIHLGHVRMLEAASRMGDKVMVIVNNDVQQRLKKGKIIMAESERLEVVRAIRYVDEAILAVDDDPSIVRTLEHVASSHPGDKLCFANGGDRKSAAEVPETAVCEKFGIEMRFGVGGDDKINSSSKINQRRGEE